MIATGLCQQLGDGTMSGIYLILFKKDLISVFVRCVIIKNIN